MTHEIAWSAAINCFQCFLVYQQNAKFSALQLFCIVFIGKMALILQEIVQEYT